MLFSILIANYNNSDYLYDCIYSCINQTYKNLEIIIIDDASTDNSNEIIFELKQIDSRIKVYQNEQNRGIGWTKRELISKSSGVCFGFLDPDDMLELNAVSIVVEEHKKRNHVGLIYSNLKNLLPDGTFKELSNYNGPIPEGTTFLEYGKGVSAFATLKRKFYNLTDGINPLLKIAEDQDLYFKMEEVAPILYVDEPLYLYRNHKGSISLFDNQVRAHVWQVIARYEAYKRRGLEINEKQLIDYFVRKEARYLAFYNNMYTLRGPFLQLLKAIKKILLFSKKKKSGQRKNLYRNNHIK